MPDSAKTFDDSAQYAFALAKQPCYIQSMSYEDRIRQARPRMSKSFARLADYILDSYVQTVLMTATELAHQVDVDAATVVRFAQSLDYKGFPELQDDIKQRVLDDLLMGPAQAEQPDSLPGVVDATMRRLGDALEQARKLLNAEAVAQLVKYMGEARRIILLPQSLAQASAYNLVNLLEQGGFLVSAAQDGVSDLARTVSTAQPGDLILGIDVTGETPFISRALAEAKKKGLVTAAIVGAASLESARAAEVVLAAQTQPDVGAGIVVVDAIVYTLAEGLRWQYAERFRDADQAIEAMFRRIRAGR
jgi:DNA-binding MurR/RpiR family transcriptional regulator